MQDNIINLINKHLNRETTEEEKMRLSQWLEESEENKRFYSLFAANCSLHKTITSPGLNVDLESMMMRLHARIDEAEKERPRFPRKAVTWAVSALAAASLLVFAVGPFGRQASQAPAEPPMELASNITSKTVHIVLDDGTQVYLHPGASIRYNVSTISNRREVKLSGDAYFDVTRDEARPFVVNTPNIGVQVLGTSFSVSGAEEISQVVLERGSVRILSPEGGNMVTLTPNQKATFKSLTGDIRVEPVYATAFVTDKYRLVSMSDVTVQEITARLTEIFGKKISCRGGDGDKRYNLAFLKSDSLEDVLSIVEYLTGAQCDFK